MPYLVGIGLAVLVTLFARYVGLDRDRAFYPTVMIVIAGLYGLFALIAGSPAALAAEAAPMLGFILMAVIGFRFNLWWVAAALFGHGVFDLFHGHIIANPGVPPWWAAFCGAYDVTAAACLAGLLLRGAPAKPAS